MKLSRKEFKILQLVDNRDDFTVEETLYILGISWSYNWWGIQGMNSEIPYSRYNSAKEKLEELKKIEERDCIKRDGGIILFTSVLIAVFILLLYILKN